MAAGVKRALNGALEDLLLDLLMPPLELEASRLQQAMAVSCCFYMYMLGLQWAFIRVYA